MRPRPNISYRQADLHELDDDGGYDFILSVLTLHHVPDLHAALCRVKGLLAPGGRGQVQRVGGPRGVAVIWDAPLPPAGSDRTC
jgi:hypothetical protein